MWKPMRIIQPLDDGENGSFTPDDNTPFSSSINTQEKRDEVEDDTISSSSSQPGLFWAIGRAFSNKKRIVGEKEETFADVVVDNVSEMEFPLSVIDTTKSSDFWNNDKASDTPLASEVSKAVSQEIPQFSFGKVVRETSFEDHIKPSSTDFISSKEISENVEHVVNKPRITASEQWERFIGKISSAISFSLKKSHMDNPKYKRKFEEFLYYVRESATQLFVLSLSVAAAYYSYTAYIELPDKLQAIPDYYSTKKLVWEENEKIRLNKQYKELAETLLFGKEIADGTRYPQAWFLNEFSRLFPNDLSDLNILTFLEWWSSDFVDFDWKRVRVNSDIVESFKKMSDQDFGDLKGATFSIVLKWSEEKVETFLSDLKYKNKIPKDFRSIDETYDPKTGIMSEKIEVVFYYRKSPETTIGAASGKVPKTTYNDNKSTSQ